MSVNFDGTYKNKQSQNIMNTLMMLLNRQKVIEHNHGDDSDEDESEEKSKED